MLRIPRAIFTIRACPLVLALTLATSLTAEAASNSPLTVTAVILSKSNCKFSAGAVTLNFGTINPSSGSNATATATKGFSCAGSAPNATFVISAGNGLHSTGPAARRVQHATIPTEFMAYSLTLTPASATVPKNTAQTLTFTGTIIPADFQNAAAGTYSDTVVITLNP